jgi:hypothetical protein
MIVSFVSSFSRGGCKGLAVGIGIRTSEASGVCAKPRAGVLGLQLVVEQMLEAVKAL